MTTFSISCLIFVIVVLLKDGNMNVVMKSMMKMRVLEKSLLGKFFTREKVFTTMSFHISLPKMKMSWW